MVQFVSSSVCETVHDITFELGLTTGLSPRLASSSAVDTLLVREPFLEKRTNEMIPLDIKLYMYMHVYDNLAFVHLHVCRFI